MSKRPGIAIKISAALCIVLFFLAVSRLRGTPARTLLNGNDVLTAQENTPFDQAQALAELGKKITGKENKPAEEVFKNIRLFKGVPAGRLLRIMELGYSRSLGVNCTHCHVVDQWEKDDKPTKQIARDMAAMVKAIDNDYLKKIKNLKSDNPIVNCTTCHRPNFIGDNVEIEIDLITKAIDVM